MRVLGCSLVLLGVCVFAWGLKYKLSLYDPPQSVSHRMPAAKLLAAKDDVALESVDLRSAPHRARRWPWRRLRWPSWRC
jgi:hypothetical protein